MSPCTGKLTTPSTSTYACITIPIHSNIYLLSCLCQAAWHLLLASSHLLHAHLLYGAIRESLERYLKLSSLIISRIPQDTPCDVTKEGRRGRGREGKRRRKRGLEKVMLTVSLLQGFRGRERPVTHMEGSKRLETKLYLKQSWIIHRVFFLRINVK